MLATLKFSLPVIVKCQVSLLLTPQLRLRLFGVKVTSNGTAAVAVPPATRFSFNEVRQSAAAPLKDPPLQKSVLRSLCASTSVPAVQPKPATVWEKLSTFPLGGPKNSRSSHCPELIPAMPNFSSQAVFPSQKIGRLPLFRNAGHLSVPLTFSLGELPVTAS